MNKYEGVFILKSDMEEETRKKVFEKIVSTITEDGKVENVDEWGNRKLAYEINYIKEEYYYVVDLLPRVVARTPQARTTDRKSVV